MVAYSFRPRFVAPILAGSKRQTIRAKGKRRHARPGEVLQLYSGMRTKHCKLIARATCDTVRNIAIDFEDDRVIVGGIRHDLDEFAKRDGFKSWDDFRAFWDAYHGVPQFFGVIIFWKDLSI